MKTNLKFTLTVLLSALILVLGAAVDRGQAQTQPPTAQANTGSRTISVTGSGQAGAQPDVAVVRLGARTDADTAQEALSENNRQMQALLNALTGAGVPDENIQTSFVQLQPRYNQPTGDAADQLELIGYTAINIVQVRLEDIDRLGEVLDAAVNAGGNTIEGIHFELSDPSSLYAEAMEEALEDARLKAEQLADLAGVELGEIVSISEGFNNPIPFAGGGALNQVQADVVVAPGMQSIFVQLQVTWELGSSAVTNIPVTGGTHTSTPTPAAATSGPTRTQPAAASPSPTGAQSSATATATRQSAAGTVNNFNQLVRALEAEGAEVDRAGVIRQPLFPATANLLDVNGAEIQVFEFEDPATRSAVSATITENGEILGGITPTWSGKPNFWAQGSLIVLYVGQNQEVIALLSDLLGDPITGN